MRLSILAVGTRMQPWVYDGFDNYAKRLPKQFQLRLEEIPAGQRTARADSAAAKDHEAEQLLRRSAKVPLRIALDERGEHWTTQDLARELQAWMATGANVAFLIGGPDGLSESCRQSADRVWSLSRLTLPHGLVRVVLAEQLYRAWTILQGHPYHRS